MQMKRCMHQRYRRPFNVERFVEKVRVMQEKKPSIVIAVSEGVKLEDGRYVCELADDVHAVDAFGHKALTGTARYLANVVARNLDTKTRCIELSTLQRCAGHLTSRTDITEAYQVGGAAAKAAFEGVTGQMVALKRISNNPYQCTSGYKVTMSDSYLIFLQFSYILQVILKER